MRTILSKAIAAIYSNSRERNSDRNQPNGVGMSYFMSGRFLGRCHLHGTCDGFCCVLCFRLLFCPAARGKITTWNYVDSNTMVAEIGTAVERRCQICADMRIRISAQVWLPPRRQPRWVPQTFFAIHFASSQATEMWFSQTKKHQI